MSKKKVQPSLFSDETGSPLFSNSAVRVDEEVFAPPKEEGSQKSLFGQVSFEDLQPLTRKVTCPICRSEINVGRDGCLEWHLADGSAPAFPAIGEIKVCAGSFEKI